MAGLSPLVRLTGNFRGGFFPSNLEYPSAFVRLERRRERGVNTAPGRLAEGMHLGTERPQQQRAVPGQHGSWRQGQCQDTVTNTNSSILLVFWL